MKVQKLIHEMYKAIIEKNQKKEKKLWMKTLKKSLKHKNTQAIK